MQLPCSPCLSPCCLHEACFFQLDQPNSPPAMDETPDSPTGLRDVTPIARLTVSSFKDDHPPERLRDGNPGTYWQSDGPQPHYVNVEFPQRMALTRISLYIDHAKDESYTPRHILIRAGNSFYDMQDFQQHEVPETTGWVDFSLSEDEEVFKPLRAHVLQLSVVENYQHGKDTHVRGLKLWATAVRSDMLMDEMPPFSTYAFQMYSTVR
ncbi:anaphase-promoting complex, subunit 10/DOC domain-containing protein [Fimicolochytrium jonesii]|uniref:anaphase-promoting complex, subunit 10/DOC domain-containing protein n=1 Tax=Fimicolochytrium jonesii TaxID=1396493 RepID=UPI0022FEAC56|nr:anaphase-promoting complex, subunit 10/DOC domain-containing protein [Fimicolochytrium jonesii]KAI8818897.1 anaphase-promoting complex, subunit 10/DOC domain-containing protein [Fimicolochytrium jonesii]